MPRNTRQKRGKRSVSKPENVGGRGQVGRENGGVVTRKRGNGAQPPVHRREEPQVKKLRGDDTPETSSQAVESNTSTIDKPVDGSPPRREPVDAEEPGNPAQNRDHPERSHQRYNNSRPPSNATPEQTNPGTDSDGMAAEEEYGDEPLATTEDEHHDES